MTPNRDRDASRAGLEDLIFQFLMAEPGSEEDQRLGRIIGLLDLQPGPPGIRGLRGVEGPPGTQGHAGVRGPEIRL